MKIKTVIVYFGEKTEAFSDLKKFCKVKGLKYNTWKQAELPKLYKGYSVERLPSEGMYQAIEIYGESIRIQ